VWRGSWRCGGLAEVWLAGADWMGFDPCGRQLVPCAVVDLASCDQKAVSGKVMMSSSSDSMMVRVDVRWGSTLAAKKLEVAIFP